MPGDVSVAEVNVIEACHIPESDSCPQLLLPVVAALVL